MGNSGVNWPATVRDISVAGIGLALNRAYEPGTLLNVKLQNATGSVFFLKVVRVQHVRPETSSLWYIGGTFPTRFQKEELRALL
jgi:hypothetical protein